MPRLTPRLDRPVTTSYCRCPCGTAAAATVAASRSAGTATTAHPSASAPPPPPRRPALPPRPAPARRLHFDPLALWIRRSVSAASNSGGGGGGGSPGGEGGGASGDASAAAAAAGTAGAGLSSLDPEYWDSPDDGASASYCIIESRESVKDFAGLGVAEVRAAISARRNKIYFLMEEVRRLRIQERLKMNSGAAPPAAPDQTAEPFPSALPFFPPLSDGTVATYTRFYGAAVAFIILFGGLVAPILEVKLGLGGTSYADVIAAAHLPAQLAQVDPIVASFCGGAVGVLTALLIVEVNNAAVNAANRCVYCAGTGYVTCGACGGAGGAVPAGAGAGAGGAAPAPTASAERCATCSGTGKVACIACLCTGKKVAREGDPRLDPFS